MADGRDPAARLDRVANRTEAVAEHSGGCIEVLDREGDPPEAGRAILDAGVLHHLEEHLAEAEEPLLQRPVIGLHLTHPPALDPELTESVCRPVQLRREDDEVIDLGDADRVASAGRRTSLRRRCLRQPVDLADGGGAEPPADDSLSGPEVEGDRASPARIPLDREAGASPRRGIRPDGDLLDLE